MKVYPFVFDEMFEVLSEVARFWYLEKSESTQEIIMININNNQGIESIKKQTLFFENVFYVRVLGIHLLTFNQLSFQSIKLTNEGIFI